MRAAEILLVLALTCFVGAQAAAPEVETEYGRVRGETKQEVDIYHSIPFAAPPVGELRVIGIYVTTKFRLMTDRSAASLAVQSARPAGQLDRNPIGDQGAERVPPGWLPERLRLMAARRERIAPP